MTNTLGAPSTTGIQRVTRELLRGAGAAEFDVVPIRHDEVGWRRLTTDEHERLRAAKAPHRRRRDVLGGSLRSLRTWRPGRPTRGPARRAPTVPEHLRDVRFGPGDVFLDLDAAWHEQPPRSDLLPELRAAGVPAAVLIHDVIPFEHPEWFVPEVGIRFREHIRAHLRNRSRIFVASRDTETRLRRVAEQLDISSPTIERIGFGCDPLVSASVVVLPDRLPSRYVLCVGTIEPRKNHQFILDVMAGLTSTGLGLVVVGRIGWHSELVVRRLRRLDRRDPSVRWLTSVDDATLEALYRGAAALAVPSLDEGYGLPILEARRHGIPVVASDRGAMPEAVEEGGIVLAPDDHAKWQDAIRRASFPGPTRVELEIQSRARPPETWADAAAAFWPLMNPDPGPT